MAYSDVIAGFIERHLPPQARLGVAVSGGVDSIVLLDLLHEIAGAMGLKLVVLHLDHRLRPESGADREFVEATSARYGLRCVSAVIEEDLTGPSIENAAREARYRFFRRCAEEYNLDAVATAHTADDQAETVLFRLLRGTGKLGLAGIRPVRRIDDVLVLRPLLSYLKAELENHAHGKGLSFRKDASNDAMRYRRNRIRHQVLPFLREHLNPRVDDALRRLSEIVQEEEDWIGSIVSREMAIWKEYEGGFRVNTARFGALHGALRARQIVEILVRLGAPVDHEIVERIDAVALCGGRVDLRSDFAAWIEEGRLFIGREPTRDRAPEGVYRVASDGSTEIPDLGLRILVTRQPGGSEIRRLKFGATAPPTRLDRLKETAFFDASSIDGALAVRMRRDGDRMTPFGMIGTKKVQDIFTDGKISLHQRNRWPILCDNKGILWIVGIKQDERTRVTKKTRTIMRVDVSATDVESGPERIA